MTHVLIHSNPMDAYPMSTNTLSRREAADAALQQYSFGEAIVDEMSGWEFTQPGLEYTRTLFFVNPDAPDGYTMKGHFTVRFESDSSSQVSEAYALLEGNPIGSFGVSAPSP